jgi:hypothetical protein
MGWKQWAVVVVVIGAGVLLQIPDHDREAAEHVAPHPPGMAMEEADPRGPYATIALEVTGMT